MAEPIVITPDPPANPGLDYAWLKAEGITLLQELSGQIWTDYNESDPGVTTLEQLCYALTELSYRAELPLVDLLTPRVNGRIQPRQQAMFIPKRIFPCNPVTVNDYRKLIVDRIPEIANAWLTPYCPRVPSRGVHGLYDISLYVPGLEPPPCTPLGEVEKIENRVRRVYCRHRNLCEDLRSIQILRPVEVTVQATVTLAEGRTPEAVLAGIFFNVGNLLAPELRRQPLKSLLDQGLLPSAIFNGPLLVNGFIDDAQLEPKAAEIPIQEVVGAFVRTPGVLSVRDLQVRKGGKVYSGNDLIPVGPREILRLDTWPDTKRGGFTVRLFRNGIEAVPRPARVQRELKNLWEDYRRTYRLSEQYGEYFAFPQGRYRDVEAYYSVQDQFPNTYGINAYGLPGDAPDARKGQAKQLKGYLLVFDQMLADFFAQLAHARELYSTDADLRRTYFFQYLERSVPDVGPLLKSGEDGYRPGLPRILRSHDPVVERRNRFLDFLLALYGEGLDAASIWDLTDRGEEEEEELREKLIRAKLALLDLLVASTHNRGRGIDYLERPTAGNVAGMELKSRIQLGLEGLGRKPFFEVLDELAVELVAGGGESSLSRPLGRYTDVIQEQFAPVEGSAAGGQVPPPRGIRLPEELLSAGGAGELRVGSLSGDREVSAVWKPAREDGWRLVGKYTDREGAETAAQGFAGLLRTLGLVSRQLYIAEHTLLRFGRFREQASPPLPFAYSFTITAVVSGPPRLRDDPEYRAFVRQVIRENTPAHLVADFCFLGPLQMLVFEALYWAWRQALRLRRRQEIIDTSVRLRDFLEQHSEGAA